MLLDAGHIARRHATSELRRHRGVLVTRRPFSQSFSKHRVKLRYLNPHEFQPRPDPNPAAKSIAVLGGGVTGLTTAYWLATIIPHATVTVYEKSGRFGGWIDSEVVPVRGGEAVFEWGPRSLRPSVAGAGWATINLLDSLRPTERARLLDFDKKTPAATGRYIYYPDHLVRMPSGSGSMITSLFDLARNLWSEPLFQGVLPGLFHEPNVDKRPSSRSDESVGDFLKRRFGPEVADNFASAVIHGIYAGDIYKLSMRTLLPELWHFETRHESSPSILLEVLQLAMNRQQLLRYQDVKYINMTQRRRERSYHLSLFERSSVVTWSVGMQFIVDSLIKDLEQHSRVILKSNTDIKSIAFEKGNILITDESTHEFDYVVSTLPPASMKALIRAQEPASMNHFDPVNKSASVMVVNLWFAERVLQPQHEGFGYLIPQSVPAEENPERALGVIFAHNMSGSTESEVITKAERQAHLEELEDAVKEYREFKAKRAEQADAHDVPSERLEEAWQALVADGESLERQWKIVKSAQADWPDEVRHKLGQDTVRGHKLVVMLGGHWWDGWQASDFPSEAEGIAMAKSVLRRHLNITVEPEVAKARLQRDCIPQYPVGYRDMMAKIHKDVLMKEFKGHMKVAGPWYQGAVGVNDCIRRAHLAAIDIRERWDQNTGLEGYLEDEKWVIMDKDTGRATIDHGN